MIRIRVPDIIFNHISHRNNKLKILLYFRLSHYDIGGTNIVGSKFGLGGQNNLGLGQPVSEEELVSHIQKLQVSNSYNDGYKS